MDKVFCWQNGVIKMVLAATGSGYPLLGVIWTMSILFGLILWFWLFFVVLSDLFRRGDVSGWGKAGWTVTMIVLPFIGILAYLIVRGRATAERRGNDAAPNAASESDIRSRAGSGSGSTNEIARAKRLRDSGDITAEEYETRKRQALAD